MPILLLRLLPRAQLAIVYWIAVIEQEKCKLNIPPLSSFKTQTLFYRT